MSANTLKVGIDLSADSSKMSTGIGRAIDSMRKLDTQTAQSAQKTQQLTQAATAMRNPINSIGTAASQTQTKIQQYSRSVESAAHATDKVSASATRAKSAVASMGTSAGQSAQQMQRMQQTTTQAAAGTSRLNAQSIGTAASIGTMGAGLISLEASMSNYTKAAQKVDKAEQGIQKTRDLLQTNTVSLQRAELRLEKAMSNGKSTTEQVAALEANRDLYRQKIATATEELTIKEQDLNIALMDQADTHKLMASSIATTLLGTLSAAAQMISAKSAATVKDTLTTGANTKATKTNALSQLTSSKAFRTLFFDITKAKTGFSQLSTNMRMSTIQSKGFTGAMRGAAGGVKGLMMSLGPVGIIMTLATSLYAAWETSQDFRDGVMWIIDELQKLWKILSDVIAPLKWLDEGLQSLGINVGENVDQWQDANRVIGETGETMQDTSTTVTELDGYEQDMTQTLAELETQTDAVNVSTVGLAETVSKTSDNFLSLTASTLGYKAALALLPGEQNNYTDALNKGKDALTDIEGKLQDTKTELMALSSQYVDASEKGPAAMHLLQEANGSAVISMIEKWVAMGGTMDNWMINLWDMAGGSKDAFDQMTESVSSFAGNTEQGMNRADVAISGTGQSVKTLMFMLDELSKKKSDTLNDLSHLGNVADMTKTQIERVINEYNKMKLNDMLDERGMPKLGQHGITKDGKTVYTMGYGESGFLNKETGQIDYEKLQQIGDISARNLAKIKQATKDYYGQKADQYLKQLGLVTNMEDGSYHSSVGSKEDFEVVRQMAQTGNFANEHHEAGGAGPDHNFQEGASDSKRGVQHRNQRDAARNKSNKENIAHGRNLLKVIGTVGDKPPDQYTNSPGRAGAPISNWISKLQKKYDHIMTLFKKHGVTVPPMSGEPFTTHSRKTYGGFLPAYRWTDAAKNRVL